MPHHRSIFDTGQRARHLFHDVYLVRESDTFQVHESLASLRTDSIQIICQPFCTYLGSKHVLGHRRRWWRGGVGRIMLAVVDGKMMLMCHVTDLLGDEIDAFEVLV
jgi:hypothetical protein